MENGTPETTTTDTNEVDYEKRFKDTQAAYTKSQQLLKTKDAEIEALKKLTPSDIKLSPEVTAELEDLKYSDPEAWRVRLNIAESEAAEAHQNKISELTGKARQDAEMAYEIDRRDKAMEEFNRNSDTPLTIEAIEDDVPPRIKKKLENNEISFEEFLEEARTYLSTGKSAGNPSIMGQPNLNKIPGGNAPSTEKADKSLAKQYKDIRY